MPLDPITREEQFYSRIAGESGAVLEPITRKEHFLARIAGDADAKVLDPKTRTEQFLQQIIDSGGGGGGEITVEALTATENGVYTAPTGKAYTPVTVAVPVPPEVDVEPLSVTENGTYTAPTGKAYSPVTVAVPAGDPNENLEKINNNTLTSISSNMTSVKQYLFAGCTNLTQINLPALTEINTYAFYKCGFSSFVTENNVDLYSNCFRECANLATVVLKGGFKKIDISVFERCSALQAVDCSSLSLYGIQGGAFYNTVAIEALILRQTDDVVKLSSAIPASSALTTTGYIYVPAALVDTYKAATNWAVVASRITSIEGSYYETHYADGTLIPTA